jgi:hypothetical protein
MAQPKNDYELGKKLETMRFVFPPPSGPEPLQSIPRADFANLALNKDHVCKICLCIAKDPMQCQQCFMLACAACIDPYLKSSICPSHSHPLSRSEDFQPLRDIHHKCARCNQDVPLNEYDTHKCTICKDCQQNMQRDVVGKVNVAIFHCQ